MGLQKHYWPELFNLMRKLCKYYLRYREKLPTDLPADVKAALEAVAAACLLLEAYDASHPGGGIV